MGAPEPVATERDPLPPSGSRVAPGIDTASSEIGTAIVVRGQMGERESNCEVRSVVVNDSHYHVSRDIRVASLSSGPGIPPGLTTVYLLPYNQYVPSGLWRLAEDPRGTALVPSDAQVAQVWGQALLGDDPTWLPEVTALPFVFRSTDTEGRCQREVKNHAELRELISCLHQGSNTFVEGLLSTNHRVTPEGLTSASPRLKQLALGMAAPNSNWVHIAGDFDGVHSSLLLRLQGEGSRKRVSVALGDVVLDPHGVAEMKRRANYESMVRAIDRGDAQSVQKLIGQGAAVDDTGRDDSPGDPPITTAAAKGNLAIVDVLLKAGANPNACCCSCITALHRAIEGGHSSIVTRLLEGGADPRIRYDGRMSTLELARRAGNPEIIHRIEGAVARSLNAK
jgi:hypothetical protein